jgi:hypothetical protein
MKMLRVALRKGIKLLITGSPGLGKTAIVKQIAQEIDHKLIISHPQLKQRQDYQGMPTIQGGQGVFVPFDDLQAVLNATEPTVLFLDDLGQSPESVQAALMQLMHGGSLNGKKVPDCVKIVAATNRRQDKAFVKGLIEPLKSRFDSIVHLRFDLHSWVEWAYDAGLDQSLISFVNFKPDLIATQSPTFELVNSASPRTMESADRIIQGCAKLGDDSLEVMLSGAAGYGWTLEYMAFREIFMNLPSPAKLLADPDSYQVPKDDDGNVKRNVVYALSGSIVRHATEDNMANVLKLAEKFGKELEVLTLLSVGRMDAKLAETEEWQAWFVKHSDYWC